MRQDDLLRRKEPTFDGTPEFVAFRRPIASRQDKLLVAQIWIGADTRDLLAFLHSLTAPDATRWQARPLAGCRSPRVVGDLDIR